MLAAGAEIVLPRGEGDDRAKSGYRTGFEQWAPNCVAALTGGEVKAVKIEKAEEAKPVAAAAKVGGSSRDVVFFFRRQLSCFLDPLTHFFCVFFCFIN